MVDIVDQLREVKSKDFHPDSLRTMVLWGADEIERLRHIFLVEGGVRYRCPEVTFSGVTAPPTKVRRRPK